MVSPTFVIIGAGLAGAKAAEALRKKGFDGQLILLGDEHHRPYERPPLSKDILTGKAERESAFVHPQSWYADHDVDLRLGTQVAGVDRAAHEVVLGDGSRVGYAKLLLATGAEPRALPGAQGTLQLRRFGDTERLRQVLESGSRLAVVGAGWIGLEVAAAARQAGLEVTVLEALELPLLPALGPEAARVFADLHTAHGVDLRLGVKVAEASATHVKLADGTRLDADAVLVGIGAVPNTALAEAAGLLVDNGIRVDAHLRTSDPDIFAAGDVANADHPFLRHPIRVEHWANALKQPAVAAAGMLGTDEVYDELPYFYTDQYDLGMEYLGHNEGYDRVVFRGDVEAREFIAFWLKDGKVVAGMNVNVWDVTDPIKALIRSGTTVDVDRLADPSVPLPEAGTDRTGTPA
ncbi:NADPH-dependent 2,4-dienoyl-CoA reductase/sulfur reductase-like enzyme [Amycolatopsis bartoniae]|uniref:Pyridine nucleotide-disulfide oxidoreductase n=1 Tax=Amycolatopsis bartoniae TaxID=941986 RepID=A0A8H9MF42_9PSEU|nr:FAD-dependent oxidoreductase [Amycolatopsis bartoniae]MBB2939414.1 NADPH-dependent 2,4-dienoyl-CoA reductase/sulfur reductase-like enzyme [Amycolatopsis bartoniae]TVT00969.1 NAD(P)/FAD-dependent oxidoreductase [Amycolatopsis bartoniae]GHF83188.1 pyridine nucleotide-disulfide oxidoreductase [Amycolatopsis bartoniae]